MIAGPDLLSIAALFALGDRREALGRLLRLHQVQEVPKALHDFLFVLVSHRGQCGGWVEAGCGSPLERGFFFLGGHVLAVLNRLAVLGHELRLGLLTLASAAPNRLVFAGFSEHLLALIGQLHRRLIAKVLVLDFHETSALQSQRDVCGYVDPHSPAVLDRLQRGPLDLGRGGRVQRALSVGVLEVSRELKWRVRSGCFADLFVEPRKVTDCFRYRIAPVFTC